MVVLAGQAQGNILEEIESVIESAKGQQKEIGRIQCATQE